MHEAKWSRAKADADKRRTGGSTFRAAISNARNERTSRLWARAALFEHAAAPGQARAAPVDRSAPPGQPQAAFWSSRVVILPGECTWGGYSRNGYGQMCACWKKGKITPKGVAGRLHFLVFLLRPFSVRFPIFRDDNF